MTERRYPSVGSDPRELRSKAANRKAALALIIGLLVAVLAIALFVA